MHYVAAPNNISDQLASSSLKPISFLFFTNFLPFGAWQVFILNLVDNEVNGNVERKMYSVIAGHVHKSQ